MKPRYTKVVDSFVKICSPAIAKRTDCEVNPVGVTLPFYYQLIEILVVQVTDVQQ